MRDRRLLTNPEAAIVKHLVLRCGAGGCVSLTDRERKFVLSPWRNGLIEIWFRHVPQGSAAIRGPFYGLSVKGYAIGNALWAASRSPPELPRNLRFTAPLRRNPGGVLHDYP